MQFGHDAEGNIVITGEGNRVFVFPGITTLAPDVLTELTHGKLKPQDVPEAIPLPTLTLRIEATPGDEAVPGAWTLTALQPGSESRSRRVPVPWQTEPRFAAALEAFWRLTRRAVENEAEHQALHAHASILGEALSTVLAPEDRRLLVSAARYGGSPPLLVIEGDDDLVLALPWELLRLEGVYAVCEGRLDVARCVPAKGAPHLGKPTTPVTLLLNVSAPEGSGLDYEVESYYILRALHDHVGVIVSEMGEVDDLLKGIGGEPAPLGVHFSGHGGPGELLFENEFGAGHPVRIEALLHDIRRAIPESFPRFFYLACCHGSDPPSLVQGREQGRGGIASSATALHRDGVTQVVGHFGPVH